MLIHLAIKSLLNRKGSIILTIATMSVSLFVMLGVEHIRHQAKSSFASSVSGVDLIVGARTGSMNLLLYSVFRIGTPTNNLGWQSYKRISKESSVRWTVPISLGDSHKGYRVMGTTPNYFKFYSFGNKQQLRFKRGKEFESVFDLVLGANIAEKLGYRLGDNITLSHGIGSTSFSKHDNLPFKVVGILKATGTPVDQTLHVSLQGLEAVHVTKPLEINRLIETPELTLAQATHLTPKSITAIMIGLKSKMTAFNFQRQINTDNREPLSAILPGVALSQLWQTMSIFDNTLHLITLLVIISSLIGLSATLLSSIRERLNEIKLLRIIGASSTYVFSLIELEALLIAFTSTVIALIGLSLTLSITQEIILNNYGVMIVPQIFSKSSLQLIIGFLFFVFLAAIPPAVTAFNAAK
ncbi:MAG TPA: peptide ABC transporter permease [Colwellia sp.]|jgi:putative ABC transport system permease protein|nr:peptide ABC transporter permease [Colwellia sp.]